MSRVCLFRRKAVSNFDCFRPMWQILIPRLCVLDSELLPKKGKDGAVDAIEKQIKSIEHELNAELEKLQEKVGYGPWRI